MFRFKEFCDENIVYSSISKENNEIITICNIKKNNIQNEEENNPE